MYVPQVVNTLLDGVCNGGSYENICQEQKFYAGLLNKYISYKTLSNVLDELRDKIRNEFSSIQHLNIIFKTNYIKLEILFKTHPKRDLLDELMEYIYELTSLSVGYTTYSNNVIIYDLQGPDIEILYDRIWDKKLKELYDMTPMVKEQSLWELVIDKVKTLL